MKPPKPAMSTKITLDDFRSTRKTILSDPNPNCETIYTYWNNNSGHLNEFDRDETLHIVREASGLFYLQIANIVQRGSLEQLEEKLYAWAKDEGWLDD